MKRARLPLLVLVALQILDLATTYRVIALGGVEQNPPLAWLLAVFGFGGLVILKLVVTANTVRAARKLINRGRERWVMNATCGLAVIYAGVIGWNCMTLARYAP